MPLSMPQYMSVKWIQSKNFNKFCTETYILFTENAKYFYITMHMLKLPTMKHNETYIQWSLCVNYICNS